MGSGLLFFIGFVYNITKMAAHYKVKPQDKCWAVLLSNKDGASRLSVCGKPEAHGNSDSAMHTHPAGWDVEFNRKTFSSKASAADCKKAGWKAFRAKGAI
jgi:hypothetical protein